MTAANPLAKCHGSSGFREEPFDLIKRLLHVIARQLCHDDLMNLIRKMWTQPAKSPGWRYQDQPRDSACVNAVINYGGKVRQKKVCLLLMKIRFLGRGAAPGTRKCAAGRRSALFMRQRIILLKYLALFEFRKRIVTLIFDQQRLLPVADSKPNAVT